jgi:DNA repair protein RecO (recombination protein O)
MAVEYVATGLVFLTKDRREADRVFSVFTREFGRVELLGRSIRKIASKLKGGVELFSVCELSFVQGKNQKTLTDAVFSRRFSAICASPEKYSVALQAGNFLDAMVKGPQRDEVLWNRLADFFSKLNDANHDYPEPWRWHWYFFWSVISAMGYRPEVSKCSGCRQSLRPELLYFSMARGGAVCQSCAAPEDMRINDDAVKILRLMISHDWETVMKVAMPDSSKNIFQVMSNHYSRYLLSEHSGHVYEKHHEK